MASPGSSLSAAPRHEPRADTPGVLFALLGSSNLTIALPQALNHLVSRLSGTAMTVFVAHGPGRSYGVDTGSFGIKFRALSRCALLPAVEEAAKDNPAADTWALLTDIGNDIMHGVSVKHLMLRIRRTVERLRHLGATVGVTSLPVEGLAEIAPWKFRVARRLVYPLSRVPRDEVLSQVNAIQNELRDMESRGEIQLLPARREWYGPDEFHLRPGRTRDAVTEWIDLLLGVGGPRPDAEAPAAISRESLYLNCRPEYRVFRARGKYQDRPFVIAPGATVRSF